MKKFILFAVILTFALCLCISASDKLSPALDVLAEENEMIKTGIVYNGEICFDKSDFDISTGITVKSITVAALPDQSAGKLMLGNLYVVENQVIYRDDLSSLKFIPSGTDESVSSFSFSVNDSAYNIKCSLKTVKSVNFSPVGANGASIETWTQKNISVFGSLNGYDPEGDELKFEIVSYPKKGIVEISNEKTGDYKYTPYEGAKGKDAFSYRVRDSYGNYSETCTVNVRIQKLKTTLVFSDMDGSKALNAALIVTDGKFMDYTVNKDGTVSFNPDEKITKEEFVALIMNALGAKDVPTLEKTRFADDEKISPEYKGYAESAFVLGIVKGTTKTDGVYFNPKDEVTVAEAAVMINSIIGAKSKSSSTTFADEEDIPEWAKSDLVSLNELGIIEKSDGKINPNSTLNRAQTAQIIMSLLDGRGKLGR